MWEKAAFLCFYATLCVAQREAVANLGGQLGCTPGLPWGLTNGQAGRQNAHTISSLPPYSEHVVRQAPRGMGADKLYFRALNTTQVSSMEVTPSTDLPPASTSQGLPFETSSNPFTITFPSDGIPHVPSSIASEISQAENPSPTSGLGVTTSIFQSAESTPTNAAEVISQKLASINSELSSEAEAGLTSMTQGVPAQDTVTGSDFFGIPFPSIETQASSNAVPSDPATEVSSIALPSTLTTIPVFPDSISIVSTTGIVSTTSIVSTISSATRTAASSTNSAVSTSAVSSTSLSSSSSHSSSTTGTAMSSSSTSPAGTFTRTTRLSGGAIAGIVVGAAVALAALAALLLWLLRRRTHQPLAQSPRVYPEEAYLYDPPMSQPRPRPSVPVMDAAAAIGANRSTAPVFHYQQDMTDAQAEREGLLGGGVDAGAAATAMQRRPVGGSSVPPPAAHDPFADPPSQAEQERQPLYALGAYDPAEASLLPPPEAAALRRSSISPVQPSSSADDSGSSDAVASGALGGLGGRSVGPHNHDIPGRYGPGGLMRRGGADGSSVARLRTEDFSSSGGGALGGAGAGSPSLREVRRAWGWEDQQ